MTQLKTVNQPKYRSNAPSPYKGEGRGEVQRGLMRHPRLGFQRLIPRKRELRQESTKTEKILWRELRAKRFSGVKFRRQHGIGPYIVDFCAPRQGIVIEIDGDVHALPDQRIKDELRQKYIESLGFCVIRYSNNDVLKNLEGVLLDILDHLRETSPNPLLCKEGETITKLSGTD